MLIAVILLSIFLFLSTIAICFCGEFDKSEIVALLFFIYLFPIWVIVRIVNRIRAALQLKRIKRYYRNFIAERKREKVKDDKEKLK